MARLRGGGRPGRRGADAGHAAGADRVIGHPVAASDPGAGSGDGREPRPLPAGGRSGAGEDRRGWADHARTQAAGCGSPDAGGGAQGTGQPMGCGDAHPLRGGVPRVHPERLPGVPSSRPRRQRVADVRSGRLPAGRGQAARRTPGVVPPSVWQSTTASASRT